MYCTLMVNTMDIQLSMKCVINYNLKLWLVPADLLLPSMIMHFATIRKSGLAMNNMTDFARISGLRTTHSYSLQVLYILLRAGLDTQFRLAYKHAWSKYGRH